MSIPLQPQKIKVDFDPNQREFDTEDRVAFLESIRPWLEEHGYFLYRNAYELFGETLESAVYSYPQFDYDGETQLPHSFFGGDPVVTNSYAQHKLPSPTPSRVVFAQDSQHRHVALKLVKDGSVEYNIYRHLTQEPSIYSSYPEEFGCIIPALDFLELEGYWFVVMPRWGHSVMMPWFDSVREVLQFMHCCLKGLSLLHQHLIAHRDIKPGNMLVSHFADRTYYDRHNELRPSLRRRGMLTYALCDFSISVMFPPTSAPGERRLPASESFITGCSFAYDTAQGELDYDPFAFDVCALGMFFCEYFQHLTTTVPMLALFLDYMIMRDIARRFTAVEALRFFEHNVLPSVTPAQFSARPATPVRSLRPERYDRWVGLDPPFVRTWAKYRLPRLEWSTTLLRWICEFDAGYAIVRWVRKMARIMSSVLSQHGRPASLALEERNVDDEMNG